MKLLILRKSKAANYKDRLRKLMDRRGDNTPDARLEKFRKLILEHLSTPDDEEPEPEAAPPAVRKAFSSMIRMEKGGKGLAVGTVREWKGRKFKKTAPGKWRPVYDSETRGAKMAIAAIKKKIAAAPDAQTMMRIILENRDRFSDKNGQPLPFVQELSKYTADQQDRRGHAENTPQESKAVQPKGEKGKGQEKTPEGKKETGRAVKADKGKKQSDGSDDGGNDEDAKRRIISNLETMAVLMDRREFTKDNYKKLFPNAKVKTPIGDVKIGENQYEKLRDKDDGGRKGLIGAMYQTLSDPVAVIREKRNGENADVYIKSFKKDGEQGIDTVISVTIEAEGMNVAISTYKRKTREVIQKIKTAGGIVYEKTKLPSLTDHAETASQLQVSPESGGESSDFEKIREKYKNATFAEGDDDEIQVGKELISGKWKLVEADTPTASHDETSFHKTPGFPTTDDGSTINDRDYGHDKEAQEIVMEIGADYDGRAVSVDNPVIVTKDGIVISGNNRTMSSKIAARKGTDKGYIEALKKKAKKFGFTPEQIDQFKHPRVIFETAENKGYSTDQFAKFNKSSKKAMSPVEAAVKVSKTIKMDTVESIAGKMIDFETLGELYADRNVVNDIFNALQRDNIITSMDRPQYVVDGGITGAGKEFLETVLIGSVINESNIRGLNREGCKSIRQKLVRAITPLIENKGMDGYSITKELNSAVDIAMQAAVDRKHFKDVDDFSRQKKLFDAEDSAVEIEIAKKLEGTQKEFAAFMQSMNGGLKYAAGGEADIFLGGVESREDILARMLNLKKAISNAVDFFRNLRAGKGPRFVKKSVPVRGADGEAELSERWMRESIEKGGFVEGEHPRAEDGRFTENGISGDGERWFRHVLTRDELKRFIKDARNGEDPGNALIGMVSDSTKEKVKELTGIDVAKIVIEGTAIAHVDKEKHRLGDDDIEKCVDVINDPISVRLSPKMNEQGLKILEFKGDVNGIIYFAEAVHKKHGGWLSLSSAYRPGKMKVSGTPMPPNGSPELTPETPRPMPSNSLSPRTDGKSSDGIGIEKSLTWSGRPLQGRAKVHGMDVSIENKKGSVRSGTDKDGHDWSIKMNFDYGYIRGTVGKDKDHVDCYVGPNPEAETVFIVHQNDPATGKYDEDKVMLGFDSEEEARKAYLSQYDRPGFLGGIDAMDIEEFKEKAFDPANKGKRLT